MGGIHYLNDNKISIPERIALIGFNNSSIASECYPPLTSVDNKVSECGKTAAQMMMNYLNKENVENVLLKCGLEIRQSTD